MHQYLVSYWTKKNPTKANILAEKETKSRPVKAKEDSSRSYENKAEKDNPTSDESEAEEAAEEVRHTKKQQAVQDLTGGVSKRTRQSTAGDARDAHQREGSSRNEEGSDKDSRKTKKAETPGTTTATNLVGSSDTGRVRQQDMREETAELAYETKNAEIYLSIAFALLRVPEIDVGMVITRLEKLKKVMRPEPCLDAALALL